MNGIFTQTTADSPLWPGYSEMLRGTMGKPPGTMDHSLQKRALKEWALLIVKGFDEAKVSAETKAVVNENIPALVDYLWTTYALAIQDSQDKATFEDRINQLKEIDVKKFADGIAKLQEKVKALESSIPKNLSDINAEYNSILSRKPTKDGFEKLLKANPAFKKLIDSKALSKEEFMDTVVAASFCTVCPSSILPETGMATSMDAVEDLALELDIAYLPPRGSKEFEEWAILHCMFKHAGKIARDWFVHNRDDTAFWNAHYPESFPFKYEGSGKAPPTPAPKVFPFKTKVSSASRNTDKAAMQFGDKELKRLLGKDVAALKSSQAMLDAIKAQDAPTPAREELKKRDINRTEAKIAVLEKSIAAKLKTALYATKNHDVGIGLDVAASVETNVKRAKSL
jgi:hypothetical protein